MSRRNIPVNVYKVVDLQKHYIGTVDSLESAARFLDPLNDRNFIPGAMSATISNALRLRNGWAKNWEGKWFVFEKADTSMPRTVRNRLLKIFSVNEYGEFVKMNEHTRKLIVRAFGD